jgi:hypothetical protein
MREYEWKLVRSRDALAMLLGIFLIAFIVIGNDEFLPWLAPCPGLDWHFFASSVVVLFLAVTIVEALNWLGWLIARARAIPPELGLPGVVLLAPGGWAGLGLAFGLVAVAYALRRSKLCETFHLDTMSLSDFAEIFSLAYGLLILTQSYFGLRFRSSSPKS